jgi:uncharacterized protein (TIGR02466 family)
MDLFSIPCWQYLLPNYDKQSIILSIENFQTHYGTEQVSNHRGFQSQKNLHSVKELTDIVNFVCDSARQAAKELNLEFTNVGIIESWSNVNQGTNSYNHQHAHQGVLSGVFYLDAPEGSGNLVIVNPGMNTLWQGYPMIKARNKYTSEAIKVKPRDGLLILWPSYVPHCVETNTQDVTRISISFNIVFS